MNKKFIWPVVIIASFFLMSYLLFQIFVDVNTPTSNVDNISTKQDTLIFEKPSIDVACLRAMGVKQYWYLKDDNKFAFIKLNEKFQIDTNLTAKDKEIIREFLNRK